MKDIYNARSSSGGRFLLPALLALILPLLSAYGQQPAGRSFISLGTTAPHAKQERFIVTPDALQTLPATGGDRAFDEFPVAPGERARAILRRTAPAIDSRTKIIAGGAGGDRQVIPPDIACFSGVVAGEAGSRIFVAAASDIIFCAVTRGDGRSYVLAPSTTSPGEHVLLDQHELKRFEPVPEFSCEAFPPTATHQATAELPGTFRPASSLLRTEIAVEADYDYFRATGGSMDKAVAYTTALFSMVSVLYENEINVTFHIPWFKVWTDSVSDPYKVKGNAYALWDTVPRYWRNNYGDVPRNLAHVLTSIDYGGGGIAFRGEKFEGGAGALCSNLYGYGMSSPTGARAFPTFAFTYDAYIVAHELGHNFGARHTHDCWWSPPLDTCLTRDDARYKLDDACFVLPITPRPSSGSIMSYCQNTNYGMSGNFADYKVEMTFLQRVAEVMRREAAASCLAEPEMPTVILKSPRGDRPYRSNQDVTITWASAKVERITLEYSPDNGRAWSTIASDVAASAGEYLWRTPAAGSSEALVRIVDAARPDVADTSIVSFAVQASAGHPSAMAAAPQLELQVQRESIRITYSLERPAEYLRIMMYDIQGREIRTIAGRDGVDGGTYSASMPVDDLPGGTYFIIIDADGARASRRCEIGR